jgi:hypothetical protein
MPIGVVRRTAKTADAGTDGDYSRLAVNDAGDLRVDGGQVFAAEQNSLAVSQAVYDTGVVIHGVVTIANAARISGGGGIVTQVAMTLTDTGNNGGWSANDVEVVFFKDMSDTGVFSDDSGVSSWDTGYITEIEGIVQLDEVYSYRNSATDTGQIKVLQAKNVNMGYICNATTLYALPIMRGSLRAFDDTGEANLRVKMIRD